MRSLFHRCVLSTLLLLGSAHAAQESTLQRALALGRAGEHAAAAALCREALARDPADGEAAYALATVTAWAGRYAESLSQLDALLAREPGNADAQLLRARVLLWDGRPEEGLRALDARAVQDAEGEALRAQLQSARDEDPRWELRVGYLPERYSFTSAGHGAGAQLGYRGRGGWRLRAGGGLQRRFGQVDAYARVGGSVRLSSTLTLSADAELAPGARVLPRQAYGLEALLSRWGRLTPSVGYRFADYAEADVHTLAPALGVALARRVSLDLRYALGLNRLQQDTVLTHSGLARVNLSLTGALRAWGGYARTEERFESGNPRLPPGGFRAHHALAGVGLQLLSHTGLELGVDQAWRSNGARVTTGSLGLVQRW